MAKQYGSPKNNENIVMEPQNAETISACRQTLICIISGFLFFGPIALILTLCDPYTNQFLHFTPSNATLLIGVYTGGLALGANFLKMVNSVTQKEESNVESDTQEK